MTDADESLLRALRTELGHDRVSIEPTRLEQMGSDTWPLRLVQGVLGRASSRPLALVRPNCVAELAAALRVLAGRRVAVVPRGGGSGVVGGAAAPSDAVVLDLAGLDRILALEEDDLMVRVEAGVGLGRLEAWLGERGYTTGHYPQSIDLAQVGGLVATRSSGQFSSKYGSIEAIVAGLEVVLASGEIVRMSAVPRRAVGPDLRQLWIGSEGAFGVISEVTLKIVPRPAERCMQAFALPSFGQGLEGVRQVMRVGWHPAVVRLYDAVEAARAFPELVEPGQAILLLLCEGAPTQASTELAAIERLLAGLGARPLGSDPVEAWLTHRNDVTHYERYVQAGTLIDTIEVAASWRAIARIHDEVCTRVPRQVDELRMISAHSSHAYPQGTNLYFSFAAQPPRDPVAAELIHRQVWSAVMDITLREGGTIAHHHGVGRMRVPWVAADLGSAHGLLVALKQALDPSGIMNPGVLLPAGDQRLGGN
ncbi:FAD-binding oxidoreductase [Nannocystaceae bacterium ST9]